MSRRPGDLAARLSERFTACLPARWRARAARARAPYRLVIDEAGEQAVLERDGRRLHETDLERLPGDAALQGLLRPHRHPLVLTLPAGMVLRRRLMLPRAARENLRQVVAYELDRITPFKADQLCFDVREAGEAESDELLPVEVALVPRKRVQPWLDALSRARIPLDRMAPADAPDFDLLPPEQRARPDPRRLALAAAPWLVVAVLAGVALWLPLHQAGRQLETLRTEEAALRRQATKVLDLRQALDGELADLELAREHWQSVPPPLEVLALLTRLLPDDTWLQQLEVKGTRLTIRGLSNQASALIGLLEKSPAFEEPRFISPVTRQRGRELFHLQATIHLPLVDALAASAESNP